MISSKLPIGVDTKYRPFFISLLLFLEFLKHNFKQNNIISFKMYKLIKIFLTLTFFSFLIQYSLTFSFEEKIKIGLLVPLSGDNKEIGQQIIKSTRIALKDINSKNIEIIPKDTKSNPNQTIKSANEFKEMGIKIVIGPVFYKSLEYLDEVEDIIFVSLTNKNVNLPKNIISAGVNATSQLNTIKKFIDMNDVKNNILNP